MYSFFSLAFKVAKSAIMYDPNKFFVKNTNMGTKIEEFYADFKFVNADLKKCPFKKL
jgi:hypothetical protein